MAISIATKHGTIAMLWLNIVTGAGIVDCSITVFSIFIFLFITLAKSFRCITAIMLKKWCITILDFNIHSFKL